MKISARNQLAGVVVAVDEGVVTSIVTVELPGGERIVSSITKESVANLAIAVGTPVYAVIKSSDVMIAVD